MARLHMDKPRILVIDDEMAICDACTQILNGEGYDVHASQDGTAGLKKMDDFKPDVVFVDLKMPGLSGIEVMQEMKRVDPHVVPVVITGFATVESTVQSMKIGAYDVLPKPFNPDQLRVIAKRALDWRKASLSAERLRQEKESLRKNYISMVSHELRTPLVAVMQYLEVIKNGFAGKISEEGATVIGRMKVRLDELLDLIDRWLKLARLEDVSFKDEYEEVEISGIVRDVVGTLDDAAARKNVRIEVESSQEEYLVMGDRQLLREVFINLVSNGVKYNHENGEVRVKLRDSGNFWVVDISDTGVGVPEADIGRLGEEFYRVKSEGTVAGSGIGLAIVKKILELHDGRLEIQSKLNEGSTFGVYLPKSSNRKRSRNNG